MDRIAAMLLLLGGIVSVLMLLLALFAVAPIICSCLFTLLYSLYLFFAYEDSGVHHAQEFENRFWTIFAILLSTALFFAHDSPLAFGLWSPSLGFLCVMLSGYAMHTWDRHVHRREISRQTMLRRSSISSSLSRLHDLGIPVEEQVAKIRSCLQDLDQPLIPSTVNNWINFRFVQSKEREIISIFRECDARALNYIIGHVQLGLLFYKIKDHRSFNGRHRSELIHLLAVERLPILTVISRVIVLHSLQLLKLRANPRAEYWVHNIILHTRQDDLSELKTLTDTKGDYFCMNKLIYEDIRSESVRSDILAHIRKEAAVQQTRQQTGIRSIRDRRQMQWRKVLSDVDDTLCSSGGSYPAGIDKRYSKKVVYPGVLSFYRELDLGTEGPEEWPDDRAGNLVFLSARPHVYKDVSEKHNFAKFEKLRGKGMHATPSLLPGDLASGTNFVITNDMEPIAQKKLDNFRRYVSIYPEYKHVFVGDNGQGDVRAGELMFESHPYNFEALYVHKVQDVTKTYGFAPARWKKKEFSPIFFRTYPEAALHAASRNPPLIRIKGLQRICRDATKDFYCINRWPSEISQVERRLELNQSLYMANKFLVEHGEDSVGLIQAGRRWAEGEVVRTPYGIGMVRGFDPDFDLYDIQLDWRPLDVQIAEYENEQRRIVRTRSVPTQKTTTSLETVIEMEEPDDESRRLERTVSTPIQEVGESSAEGGAGKVHVPKSPDLRDDFIKEKKEVKTRVFSQESRPWSRVSGRMISQFSMPSLPPKNDKRTKFMFTFLSSTTTEPTKKLTFQVGERFGTPYGLGRVVEHREKQGVVVVYLGWGTAYLRQELLKPVQKGILHSILKQFSVSESGQKQPDNYPFADGTLIVTPFGQGRFQKALTLQQTIRADVSTLAISLESWRLANGAHPILYCTHETAKHWKDQESDVKPSIFSSLGTAIVSSSLNFLDPFWGQRAADGNQHKVFKRYYKDAAAVSTLYGNGRIARFRDNDGFYEISLTDWTMANDKHPIVYLQENDIRYRIARGCREGCRVLTKLGLSGTLASVDPASGVHLVTISSVGMVGYLQPESIVCPLKAAMGEEVLTAYGDGRVDRYDTERDMYSIALTWSAKLYATADKFDRVGDGVQDHDGPFGVNWLLRFFFSSSSSQTLSQHTRSRSNSIASALSGG